MDIYTCVYHIYRLFDCHRCFMDVYFKMKGAPPGPMFHCQRMPCSVFSRRSQRSKFMKVAMMEPHTNHDQPCRCERNDPFKGAQGADPMPTDKEQKEEE